MIADLIIVDADPIRDIKVLGDPTHVRTIITGGKLVDLEQLDAALSAPLPLSTMAA